MIACLTSYFQQSSLGDVGGESNQYADLCYHLPDQFAGKAIIALVLTENQDIVYILLLFYAQVANTMYWHCVGICQWFHAESPWEQVPLPGSKDQEMLDLFEMIGDRCKVSSDDS